MTTSIGVMTLNRLPDLLAKAEIYQAMHFAIADTLVAASGVHDAMPRILRVLASSLNMQLGIYWQRTEDSSVLCFHSYWQNPIKEFGGFINSARNIKFEPTQSLPGRVMSTGTATWIVDFRDVHYLRSEAAREADLTTAIAFPVFHDLEIVGVIELFSTNKINEPDENILDNLTNIGYRIGAFIKNRQLEKHCDSLALKHQLIVDSIAAAVVVADADGNIVEWNIGAEELFGWKNYQILHQPITTLMPDKYRSKHNEGLHKITAASEIYGSKILGSIGEIEGLHKDGTTFPAVSRLATWLSAEGRFFSAVITKV